jgi:hypothetical protein
MSFPPVTFAELEATGIPFVAFIMAVDAEPRIYRDWKRRSISFEHQAILHQFLVARGKRILTDLRGLKTNKIKELPKNSPAKITNKIKDLAKKSKDIHIPTFDSFIKINDLEQKTPPLVTITKSPVKDDKNAGFEYVKTDHNFARIKQWSLPKITDDKTLVFDSVDYRSYQCNQTGEYFEFKRRGEKWLYVKSQSEIVTEKYELQSIARYILSKPLRDMGFPSKSYMRVCRCHRTVLAGDVELMRSIEYETTFFKGLLSCGMVWQCPVCSPKVSERRRVEARTAYDLHKQRGGVFSFITRTAPHNRLDTLLKVLEQFQIAEGKMKSSRKYKDLMRKMGVIGTVKSFELTIGKNGWHLHIHEVILHESQEVVDAAYDLSLSADVKEKQRFLSEFQKEFYPIWAYYAQKAGFDQPSEEHGLQVQNGDFAEAYIAKYGCETSSGSGWEVDNEMTSYHRKNSKSGISPFDCLRQYRDTRQQLYADLFFEFAYTMYCKRARQLMWSPGLKKYFGIGEKTDEEIAAELVDNADLLARISREQWQVIIRFRQRAMVLNIARTNGEKGVMDYLKGIDLILSTQNQK